jgi:hypothetical protein
VTVFFNTQQTGTNRKEGRKGRKGTGEKGNMEGGQCGAEIQAEE